MRRLCAVHPNYVVAQILRVAPETVGKVERRGFLAVPGNAGRKKPVPHDFSLRSGEMTYEQLLAHYRVSTHTLTRWNKQVGREPLQGRHPGTLPMPSPADIAAAIKRHGVRGAAAEFGVTRRTLLRWRKKLDMPWKGKPPQRCSMVGWADRYFQEKRSAAV